MGKRRNAHSVLAGKPEEKRPLGRPRQRWKDKIKLDLNHLACSTVDCIHLAQDREMASCCKCSTNMQIP
jgi:hypothetical protein